MSVLMVIAIALRVIAWHRRGFQGSLAFFALCRLDVAGWRPP